MTASATRLSVVSPDTGTSTMTYNAAGLVLTMTDALGKSATYGYDALNRTTIISYNGEQPADVLELKRLLAPCPSDDMVCWPVSPRVGNVKNNDRSLIEPLDEIVH